MSIELSGENTIPKGLEAKTHSYPSLNNLVIFTTKKGILCEITFDDFFLTAEYVLKNTNLRKNDPRIEFVRRVKRMREIRGYGSNPNAKIFSVADKKKRK